MIHFSFDAFHRMIRDLKLDVAGVGPKYFRQKLLHAQLCSSYLWTINYRPYGGGGFSTAKKELLEHFMCSEMEAGRPCLFSFGWVSEIGAGE